MLTAEGADRIGASTGPKLRSMARVSSKGLRQRDLAPAEARLAHVDGDHLRLAGVEGAEQPGIGLDRGGLPAALAHHQPADAAGGVAAGIDLAAVLVVDAHEDVGIPRRALERDHLVEADRPVVAERADRLRREPDRPLARVEHGERVAEAVHLAEGERRACHGFRAGMSGCASIWRKPPGIASLAAA